MSEFTRGQEREERRRITSGIKTSVFGLIFFWVPFLGMILASIGLVRTSGAVTQRYKARQRTGVIVCALILVIALGATTFEGYEYAHNPWILEDIKAWFMARLTGDEYYDYGGGYDYTGQVVPSMGMSNELYSGDYTANGYYNDQGQFVPYAEAETLTVPSDETGG